MNPPFAKGADIKHIRHALQFVKPGGRLVALCANGPRQQRELEPIASTYEPLPEGSFKSSGTSVRVVLLTFDMLEADPGDDLAHTMEPEPTDAGPQTVLFPRPLVDRIETPHGTFYQTTLF